MYLLGIDVGGTNTKFGLIKDGELLKTLRVSTNTFDIIRQIANSGKELISSAGLEMKDIKGISVGFPGMVIDNVVKDSPNISLQNCNIVDLLTDEFDGCPVIAMNDAELAVLAEHKMGAGKGCDNIVLMTIGTGVGGGMMIDGGLYVGKGGAGELGHMVLVSDGLSCPCGRKGCAEQYVSLKALDRMIRENMDKFPDAILNIPTGGRVDAVDIVNAYNRQDPLCQYVLDKYVGYLKDYILNICNLLRPDKVIIGGGLTYAREIIDMVAKSCKEADFGFANSPSVDILPAELGNDAGILGAIVCFDGIQDDEVNLDKINSELKDIGRVAEDSREEGENNVLNEQVEDNSGDFLQTLYDNSSHFVDNNQNEEFSQTASEETDEEDDIQYDSGLLDRLNARLKNK